MLASWKKSESEIVKVLVTLLCPTVCDPMDCTSPGSSVHGILQARIREWVAIPSPGDLPDPAIKPESLTLQADSLPSEPLGTTANSDKSRHRIKKQRHHFVNKVLYCQSYGFSSSHVRF